MISPAMIRAARALLGIEQVEVAEKARLTQRTISKAEREVGSHRDPRRRKVLQTLRGVFENEGVEFIFPSEITGEGVRLRVVR
uniref:Helix-turn-helix domain-containing protein n=1 Tax=Bradyrhizobium barranii subsp. barranii TaxID=2823807 RepID=A0A7Z0QDZ6_9BRAD